MQGDGSGSPEERGQRDAQERAHDLGIELPARAIGEFASGGPHRHRLLVGARRGHGVVGVRDGDDPAAERDRVPAETTRIAFAVESLVMLDDRVGPRPEPPQDRRGDLRTFDRMSLHQSPFVIVQGSWLVQDRGRDGELADVVHERGPSQAVSVVLGELELLTEEVGEHPHALRVPASASIVGLQRHRERQDGGGRPALLPRCRVVLDFHQSRLELSDTPRSPGDREAGRGLIGKEHRQLEQRHQGEEASPHALDPEGDDQRAYQEAESPAEPPRS